MFDHPSQTRLSIIALLVAMLGLVTAAVGQPQATPVHKASGSENFNRLKDSTIRPTQKIATHRAKDMYEEIESLLAEFRDLHKKVQQAENIDSVIAEIDTIMSDIAESYKTLASMETDIQQVFSKELATLDSTHKSTDNVIEKLNAEIANHQKTITTLEKGLQSEAKTIEKRKKEISINGLKTVINNLEGRKGIWDMFSRRQAELLNNLGTNRENIDLLFHTLKTNAHVYAEAAETIRLRVVARDALGILLGLSDINKVIAEIVNTWIVVDDIVAIISSAEFNLEATKPGM